MDQMAIKRPANRKPTGKTWIHNQVLGIVEPWVVAEALHRKLITTKMLNGREYWCIVTREEIITEENGRKINPKKIWKVPDEYHQFKKQLSEGTLQPSMEVLKLLSNQNANGSKSGNQ